MPTLWVHGTPTCILIHSSAGRPPVAAWAYNADTAAAAAAAAGVPAIGLYFFNFVTFTTKHGLTLDKAYSRGHAMYTPTLFAGHEAVFEFLSENLQYIYI